VDSGTERDSLCDYLLTSQRRRSRHRSEAETRFLWKTSNFGRSRSYRARGALSVQCRPNRSITIADRMAP